MNPRSMETSGIAALAKCALAVMVRKSRILEGNEHTSTTTFEVDPAQELGYVEYEGHRA